MTVEALNLRVKASKTYSSTNKSWLPGTALTLTFTLLTYLDEEENMKIVQVQYKRSQPRYFQGQIQRVKVWGIVDNGTDIMITGKELFEMIVSIC